MKYTSLDYIQAMSNAMDEARHFVQHMDYLEFTKDQKTTKATEQAIVIIGEAAQRVPAKVRERFPEIPWHYMMDTGHALITRYYAVDLRSVWDTVTVNIPGTLPAIQRASEILAAEEAEELGKHR